MALPIPARRLNRNPRARRRHRIEVFVQIILPLLLGITLIGWLMFWLFTSNANDVASAAQLATVLLAMPLLALGILFTLFAIIMIFLIGKVIAWIPPRTYRVQRIAGEASARIVRLANLAITPLIVIESWVGAANRLLRGEDG
ncbi:MAG: hypothetical protein ACRDFQ_04575 [Anaerolineales bacterium]